MDASAALPCVWNKITVMIHISLRNSKEANCPAAKGAKTLL
jgi:hypothetical protein